MEPKVAVARSMRKRSKVVLLRDWLTEDGSQAGVLCEALPVEECCELLGVLPGERPQLGLDDGATPEQQKEGQERVLRAAPTLLERGTSLVDEDGAKVTPAFYFPGGPRHELSLDGRQLSEHDLLNLTAHLLSLSGCLGAAAEASFLRQGRGGVGHGAGAVAVLQGGGDDPAPSAP